jgi:hypothetical protein
MTSLRQDSFAGGEISPKMSGRTSLERYRTSLRRCRNFIPDRSGAAVSRPGTDHVGPLLFDDTKVRLAPYYYSSGSTVTPFLLEFGELYLRAWQKVGNDLVLFAGNPGTTPAVTVYSAADLPQLAWAQEGNTLTLTHPSHSPYELAYNGTSWTLAPVSFARPAMVGTGPQWVGDAATLSTPTPSYPLPDADHKAKEWHWVATQLEKDADGNILESAPSPVDLSGMFATYNAGVAYKAGSFVTNGTGGYFMALADLPAGTSLPGTYSAIANPIVPLRSAWAAVDLSAPPIPVYPDKPMNFLVNSAGTAVMGGTAFGFRFYRGPKGGPLGWIGDTGSPWGTTLATGFTDTGDEPDYSVAPPQGLNPFVRGGVTENPAAVAFFEGRRMFGGTASRPHTILASAVAEYSNFDKPVVPRADTSLVFALASGRGEQIRSMKWAAEFMVLTSGTAWVMGGSNGPLAFNDIQAVPQSEIGASWLPSISPAARTLLYVRDGGKGVRGLAYSRERQGYFDEDVSLIAEHLVRAGAITDWTYAAQPMGIVWMVREDGKLVSLTVSQNEQLQDEGVLAQGPGGSVRYAWAWHDTQAASLPGISASVEAVCALRENGEDVVYLAVNRPTQAVPHGLVTNHRYLERLISRDLVLGIDGNPSSIDNYALDCAKSVTNGSPTSSVTGLGHLEGRSVYAVADGAVCGPFTVTSGAIDLGLPDGATVVHVGLAFTPELETLDVAGEKTKQKTLVGIGFEVDQSRGLSVGPDEDHLKEWRQRKVSDSYNVIGYASELVRVEVSDGWKSHARAFLRQTQPLPVTVTGITREVAFGG